MQRLLLKTLLYFFLFNYALIGLLNANSRANTKQTVTLQETRELIELGKYEEAEAIIILRLDKKPRDAQWRYLEALLKAELGLSLNSQDILNRYNCTLTNTCSIG